MPRRAQGLTVAKVRTLGPGRYGDGIGLYLLVRDAERKYWLFRYQRDGRSHEMGLGPAVGRAAVSLADARVAARALYDRVKAGGDPLTDRKAEKASKAIAKPKAVTFRQAAGEYIEAHTAEWRSAKHAAQWTATLETHAYPVIGDMAVAAIGTDDILAVLQPIWTSIPETASRVRGRIESILDYCRFRKWRTDAENPARWRGHLALSLPRKSKVAKPVHHPALPWDKLPLFMSLLRQNSTLAARALELVILTAARSGEVLKARWQEFDLDNATWVVPAGRMKMGAAHRVALSDAAVALLRRLRADNPTGDLVFPGARPGRPLSDMTLTVMLRRMGTMDAAGKQIVPHGFRSTFRDWAGDTGQPPELAEAALAHAGGSKVQLAYNRTDYLERRRVLMADYATFAGMLD